MNKLITLITTTVLLATPFTASATVIEDDIVGGPTVSPVNSLGGGMTNTGVSLGTVQEAFTNSSPMENTVTFQYARGKVYKIYVREYMDTHIILPEPIKDFSLGDTVNFHWRPSEAKNRGRILFENYDADTNLTLFGESGAAYVFYVRAIKHDSSQLPHLTAFVENPAVSMPSETKAEKGSEQESMKGGRFPKPEDGEYLRSLKNIDVTALDYNYEIISGNRALAPKYIFDDGMWTYFVYDQDNFDQVTRLPTFYRVVDGFDNPINTRKQNGTVIAEATNEGWTLRHGGSHLCIRKAK